MVTPQLAQALPIADGQENEPLQYMLHRMQVTRGRFLQKGLLLGAEQIRELIEQKVSPCAHGLVGTPQVVNTWVKSCHGVGV
ncbi:unnamed protein product [Urochloa humidicola]